MPGLPDEEDLVPLTLQPVVDRPDGWRSRSGNVVAAVLVGFIVVGLVLGSALGGGPRQADEAVAAPSAADSGSLQPSSRPTRTPRALPTPLPGVTVIGGRIPTEQRLVQANGYQIVDLGTGTLRLVSDGADGPYVAVDGGAFICACTVLDPTLAPGAVTVRFRRFDPDGRIVVNRRILRFDDAAAVPDMTDGWNYIATLAADRRGLYVLSALRDSANWTIRLQLVDTATGKLLADRTLQSMPVAPAEPRPSATTVPGGSPDGIFLWLNSLVASGDGRALFVSVNGAEVRGDAWIDRNFEWIVPIEAGVPGAPVPLATSNVVRDQWCPSRAEFAAGILGQVCSQPDGSTEPFIVRRVTQAAETLEAVPLPASSFDGRTPIAMAADSHRGAVLVWDSGKHVLARVGLDSGTIESSEVPESTLRPDERGQEPPHGYVGVDPGLVLSRDGERIYALGIGGGSSEIGVSTGIWVFDGDSLQVLDRFEPRALLTSLAVSDDGSFVYATSPAGFDVEGNANQGWPATLTVYDAYSGVIQVLYGAVDPTAWLSFAQP